jgi:hypothetical protein
MARRISVLGPLKARICLGLHATCTMHASMNRNQRLVRRAGKAATLLAGGAACVLASACAGDEPRRYEVGGAVYEFPANHIQSYFTRPHLFLRAGDPDAPYELVYDSRLAGRRHASGEPMMFAVLSDARPQIRIHEVAGDRVVCRTAPHPYSGCGMVLDDNGVQWTVLFAEKRLGEAPAIRLLALQELRRRRVY